MSLFYLHLSSKVIFLTFLLPCYQFLLEVHGDPKKREQNTSKYIIFFFSTDSIPVFTSGNWKGNHSLLAHGKRNNTVNTCNAGMYDRDTGCFVTICIAILISGQSDVFILPYHQVLPACLEDLAAHQHSHPEKNPNDFLTGINTSQVEPLPY